MLKRIVPVRVSDHAVQQLMLLIESGKLQPGDKLPVERDIAIQLGVSRPSVREALRVLEAMGLVEIRRGRGTYVLRRESANDGLREHWRRWILAHKPELEEVWQVRAALETESAALAALRATDADVEMLRRTHSDMEKAITTRDLPSVVVADYHFHVQIAELSGNRLLKQLVESALSPSDDRNRPRVFSLPGRQQRSLREHGEVIAAIAARDPGEAAAAMRRHLRGVIGDVETLAGQVEVAPFTPAGTQDAGHGA